MQPPVQIPPRDPFLFEQTLRNKKRHVYILHAGLFESAVKLFLDILPDRIACRTDDHTSLYRGIIDQLRLFTTSVYHCAKSTSIDVIASTNFLLSFAIIYLLFIALTAVASSFKVVCVQLLHNL